MPIYLCQAGTGQSDPWRFGIHVYAKPFSIEETLDLDEGPENARDRAVASDEPVHTGAAGHAIRRVRHAEICIVDDVCIAYQRYWLKLRWPGSKGGFAGYIAMQCVNESQQHPTDILMTGEAISSENLQAHSSSFEDKAVHEDADPDDAARDESSMPPSEPFEQSNNHKIINKRNSLSFQTSGTLKLLAVYDDGLDPPVTLPPSPTEPVFCRICREGLHDDADNEQPAPQAEDGGDDSGRENSEHIRETSLRNSDGEDEPVAAEPPDITSDLSRGPMKPYPKFSLNQHAQENPLLAPCECSGSMAFVHYMCVEQWRCRSRHPEAKNGLNCETCGTTYALPPPSARPAHVQLMDQEDWLDAMPPHVLQALRQPHLLWQIGASIIRRKWLRPIVPIVASPIVALYCRARRLLKKRGVARRRWACSLCRRRARWKCVRCLRSYYCSRQCQNVSWHIVHKHVCYKPSRFWQSCVFYGASAYFLLPGARRDPFIYDECLLLIPISFYAMAVIGGGMTTFVKHFTGTDFRGRPMELVVVLASIWLFLVSWGLVRGFFGMPEACGGYFGSFTVDEDQVSSNPAIRFFQSALGGVQAYFRTLDQVPILTDWTSAIFCDLSRKTVVVAPDGSEKMGWSSSTGCFEHLSDANPSFFVGEEGEKCAGDMITVLATQALALLSLLVTLHMKNQERQRRRRVQHHGRLRVPHLHED